MQRGASNSKKDILTGGITANLPQLSPQQPISNPFTKKHFQSVNSNIQVNEFGNHQISTTNNHSALE